MRMSVETTASASAPQTKVGDTAKFVLEVKALEPGASIKGDTLEKQTETVYRRTGNTTKVAFDTSTAIVMGKTADVHEGAIVHVTAKMGADHLFHAVQIVILTGYVKVQ